MDKAALLAIITEGKPGHEDFYCNTGPDKHEQEEHYTEGVSVVAMNVGLLEGWLEDFDGAIDAFLELPAADRRELWEASNFHFGIYGYDKQDADYWWSKQS